MKTACSVIGSVNFPGTVVYCSSLDYDPIWNRYVDLLSWLQAYHGLSSNWRIYTRVSKWGDCTVVGGLIDMVLRIVANSCNFVVSSLCWLGKGNLVYFQPIRCMNLIYEWTCSWTHLFVVRVYLGAQCCGMLKFAVGSLRHQALKSAQRVFLVNGTQASSRHHGFRWVGNSLCWVLVDCKPVNDLCQWKCRTFLSSMTFWSSMTF
jgi:hypothetical protein